MASFFDPFLEMARVQRDINALFGDANRNYLDNYHQLQLHPVSSLLDESVVNKASPPQSRQPAGDGGNSATTERPMAASQLSCWAPRMLSPRLDVWEEGNQTVAKLEVPGFTKDNLKIEVVDGVLRLSGESKQEQTTEKQNLIHSERRFGSFTRTIRLPKNVKEEDIRASYQDGVLHVTVPHAEPPKEQRRQINIA